MSLPACAGVILAGGRSARMGEQSKALADLGGVTMISRVVDRIDGQADPLWLSVEKADAAFDCLGLAMIEDQVESHRGPLSGLYSALRQLAVSAGPEWLLMCPCDAPFVPLDLSSRLLAAALKADTAVATAQYDGHRQPTFSVWHRNALGDIEAAVLEEGAGGLMHMLDSLPHAEERWASVDIPPFFNVNTPADLEQARRWL